MKRLVLLPLVIAAMAACSPAGHHDDARLGEATAGPAAGGDTAAAGQAVAAPAAFGNHVGLEPKPEGIASMPDEGVLARYPAVAGEQRGAYTWYETELSESHAIRAAATGVLRFTAPDGRELAFRHFNHTIHPSGDWTWVGNLDGLPAGHQAVLTFGTDAVFGNIALPDGRELRVTTSAGKTWVVETDPALEARAKRPSGNDFRVPPELAEADARVRGLSAQAATTQAVGTPLVDVAVGYTSGIVGMFGSDAAARTRINHLVSLTNQAYQNSNIDGRIRLVHAMLVGYSDLESNSDALSHLTGYDGESNVTVPASLVPLRTARETYGADLVVLLRRFNDPEHVSCGVAWLLGGGKQNLSLGYAPYGYSVVSDSDGNNFPDGGYICDDDTFAHELGHNMGNAHDRDTAAGDDGTLDDPDDYGTFQYSFGHKTGFADGNFFTIMTYGDSGQTPFRVFSNPDTTFCGGRACGITNVVDNARSMRSTMLTIANFRATVVPVASGVRNDINGDGKTDLLWRFDQDVKSNFRWWPMNGTVRGVTGTDTLTVKHTLQATGDFNGDGMTDLVWRNGEETRIKLWLSTGSGFEQRIIGSYGAGWSIVGAGDVDGDGTDDILWRFNEDVKNNFRWWPMVNGQRDLNTGLATLTVKHTLQTTGDFNGDGRVDLVWRDGEATRVKIWLSTGSGFAQQIVGSYGAGWAVAGSGDLNGDGRDDIIWRQNIDAKNNLRWWPMDGANRGTTGLATLTVKHVLRSVGDLDGNGYDDLVWRVGEDPQVQFWMNSAVGFNYPKIGAYGEGWELVDPGK